MTLNAMSILSFFCLERSDEMCQLEALWCVSLLQLMDGCALNIYTIICCLAK